MPGGTHLGSIRCCSNHTTNTSNNTGTFTKECVVQVCLFLYLTLRTAVIPALNGRRPAGFVAHLLVLILLQIARRHQTLWVDVCADWLDELRVRVHVLHLQEGQDVLDLEVVRAVCHGLAFGSQAACSHPLSVLFFLRNIENESERPQRKVNDG